ncbi:MAG: glycine cleavage system protein GcvH [Gemmataceae bacterium]
MNPAHLRYAASHEWVAVDGTIATVGITQFAVDQLTDVTYLELPAVGKVYKAGDEFGVIESVKSTSPLYAPVAGEVIEVNTSAVKDTAVINSDPFGAGWMLKLRVADSVPTDHLMTNSQYDAQLAGH